MSESTVGPGEFYQVVGVGPHSKPWPTDERFDSELLENGDRRNVLDKYRYWKVEAIVADLDTKRHDLQIAIENWQHDLNIGSIVRTANAFNVSAVHIVGKRDWNRRGAMVTDKYLTVHHHPTVEEFKSWCDENKLPIIGIDNLPVSKQIESSALKSVDFVACSFSMKERNVKKEDLLQLTKIVEAGILEIVDKQNLGWAYIKAGN
jgi:intracellular sulfur oxidation DsrE/DsrF family protein